MNITDIAVTLVQGQGSLLASADLTLDGDFVVHNIRLIQTGPSVLVAMPSRVITERCKCGGKNPAGARFCTACGVALPATKALGRKAHADIAHPTTPAARAQLNDAVLAAYAGKIRKTFAP